jgi:hypothetical protein
MMVRCAVWDLNISPAAVICSIAVDSRLKTTLRYQFGRKKVGTTFRLSERSGGEGDRQFRLVDAQALGLRDPESIEQQGLQLIGWVTQRRLISPFVAGPRGAVRLE